MQTRYLNYREDDATFTLNSKWVGILEPAVYRGFDHVTRQANLNLILEHGPTGILPTAQDTTQGRVRGVLMTKQGTVVMEDEPIVLEIAPGHFSLDRIDLIVCHHQHIQAVGGTSADYRVLTGTPGGGVPVLSQPGKQTIVGQLAVPAGAVDMRNTGIIWTKNTAELAGRPAYVLPNTVAHWTRYQTWDKPQFFSGVGLKFMGGTGIASTTPTGATAATVTITADQGVVFSVSSGGDLNRLLVPTKRRGEIFYLSFTARTRLVQGAATVDGSMLLPTSEIVVNPSDGALFLILADGSALLLHMHLGDPARLTQVNRYQRTQQQAKGTATVFDMTAAPDYQPGVGKVQLDTTGNTFPLTVPTGLGLRIAFMTAMPEGTQVVLVTTQPSRLPFAGTINALPDWGFVQDNYPVPTGYQQFRFPKSKDYQSLGAQSEAPTAFTFVSLNSEWLLTNVAADLPTQQHDRQQLIKTPISGGQGFFAVPFNGSDLIPFHTYKTPVDGGKRDYLFQHTFVASASGNVTINVNYYRNGQEVHYYSFLINDYQDNRLPYSTQFLFQNVLPGEDIEVRLFRANGNGFLKVDRSVATLDGTPSSSL